MSHTDYIVIILGASSLLMMGVCVAIREVNRYARPAENVLTRRGDIEMIDHIEPTQPLQAYTPRYLDLLNPEYPRYQRVSTLAPTYNSGPVPSYRSGTLPPPYESMDNFINSPLELELSDITPWVIFLLIFIAFIIKFKNKWNICIIILILTWFIIIYGLFMNSLYAMSILIPFSFFEIDFRDSFEWEIKSYRDKPKISYLKIQNLTEDIIKLLNSLNDDENYSMSLSFISSYKEWKVNKKNVCPLFVDDAIIINKESDPIIITSFIMNKINDKGYFVNNWLFKERLINSMDTTIITVTTTIKIKI